MQNQTKEFNGKLYTISMNKKKVNLTLFLHQLNPTHIPSFSVC